MGLHPDSKKGLFFISVSSLSGRGSSYYLRACRLSSIYLLFVLSFSLACLAHVKHGSKQLVTKPGTGALKTFHKASSWTIIGWSLQVWTWDGFGHFINRDPPVVCTVTTQHTGPWPHLTSSILVSNFFWEKGHHPSPFHKDGLFKTWASWGIDKVPLHSEGHSLGNFTKGHLWAGN